MGGGVNGANGGGDPWDFAALGETLAKSGVGGSSNGTPGFGEVVPAPGPMVYPPVQTGAKSVSKGPEFIGAIIGADDLSAAQRTSRSTISNMKLSQKDKGLFLDKAAGAQSKEELGRIENEAFKCASSADGRAAYVLDSGNASVRNTPTNTTQRDECERELAAARQNWAQNGVDPGKAVGEVNMKLLTVQHYQTTFKAKAETGRDVAVKRDALKDAKLGGDSDKIAAAEEALLIALEKDTTAETNLNDATKALGKYGPNWAPSTIQVSG